MLAIAFFEIHMINTKKLIKICLAPALLLNFQAISAEEIQLKREKANLQLPYIDAQIKVDAVMNEPHWQQALKVELNYETNPGENIKPPVKTEAYLYENGDTLYVGFKAFDPNPEEIRDYLSDRDDIWYSDLVGLKFDTFGESRKAFQFFANALGVQADSTQEDFRGDDQSWDAIWDSMGQVTDFGYVVEMAIPFKALRFPDTGKEQSWGVEILRFMPREVQHRIANTPVDREIPCQICQFDQLVGFSKIKPSQNLQITPTLVVGRTDSRDNASWDNGDVDGSAGLDVRWGVTQDIILNATINPDFSQVEADSAQLDVNETFSIFVQEKRPFFLDGADYFRTANRLVHTRDIIEPDYGLKVTGQSDSHSFGVFAANDKHTAFLIPGNQGSDLVTLEDQKSENLVVRYSKDLGKKNNIGVLLTNRSGDDYSNQVFSVDGKYWIDQNNSISYQLMSSDSKYSDQVMTDYDSVDEKNISDNAYSVGYNHDSRNWWAYANYTEFGKDFRADLGFIGRVDFDKKVIGLGHHWFPENKDSWWTKIELGGDWDITHDNQGLELEEETELNFRLQGAMQSFSGLGIGVRNRYFDDGETIAIGGELAGEYFDENYIYAFSFMQPVEGLDLGINIEKGDFIDFSNSQIGESIRLSPRITWLYGKHWRTRFDYTDVDFDVAGGDLFDAKISNLRFTYQIDIRSFIRFTVQGLDVTRNQAEYNDEVDARYKSKSSQLLYSYKINPQTLFFAGYSDEGFQDGALTKIEKTGRSLFMKFSYAWQM